jgi:hypothetical protein
MTVAFMSGWPSVDTMRPLIVPLSGAVPFFVSAAAPGVAVGVAAGFGNVSVCALATHTLPIAITTKAAAINFEILVMADFLALR